MGEQHKVSEMDTEKLSQALRSFSKAKHSKFLQPFVLEKLSKSLKSELPICARSLGDILQSEQGTHYCHTYRTVLLWHHHVGSTGLAFCVDRVTGELVDHDAKLTGAC